MKNVYSFAVIVLIIFFSSGTVVSARPDAVWRKGQLTLISKVVLDGDLSYNWSTEVVSLRQVDGRVRAFSAHQVQKFSWFDYDDHKQRTFLALSAALSNQPEPAFFEVCTDGALSVVRRLRRPHGLFKHAFSHPAYYHDQPTLAQNFDHFDYFVYDAGRLREFSKFYIDIYEPLMTTYQQELRTYATTRNINERSLLGRLVLVDRYNYLVQQDPKTASARERQYVEE